MVVERRSVLLQLCRWFFPWECGLFLYCRELGKEMFIFGFEIRLLGYGMARLGLKLMLFFPAGSIRKLKNTYRVSLNDDCCSAW